MSYADVTNPVIIHATSSVSAKIDNFVRRFAIVSNGHTTINTGESKIVYQSNYEDVLNMVDSNSSFIKSLKGFFTFSGGKEITIIEVGNEGTTQEVANLQAFIKSGINRPYVTLCPDHWYNDKIIKIQTETRLDLDRENISIVQGQFVVIKAPKDSNLSNFRITNENATILNSVQADNEGEYKFEAIGVGSSTLTLSGTYEGVESLTSVTLSVNVAEKQKGRYTITSEPESVKLAKGGSATVTLPNNMNGAVWTHLVDGDNIIEYDEAKKKITAKQVVGEASITFSTEATETHEATSFTLNIAVAETQDTPTTQVTLTAVETPAQNPAQPDALQAGIEVVQNSETEILNSAFSNLCKQYPSENDARFFMCRVTNKIDPADDPTWQSYKGTKAFFGVYDTLATDAYTLCGAILGTMANSIFDITDSNPATPLNYKTISGATFVELKESFINSLTQAPLNYGHQLVGNPVILNGRYADGYAWEYWYQWDIVCLEIEKKLSSLILNGVNNPNYVIQYNQNGIDILESGIISVLQAYQNRGAITAFAKSVDIGTNALIEEGFIKAIRFYEYQQLNKEKYENEIYDGFSFYLMIGRYIRQVVINVSLA